MNWQKFRRRFLGTVLAVVVSGILVTSVMLVGKATLTDLWKAVFDTSVFVFVTSLAATVYFIWTGKWKKNKTEPPQLLVERASEDSDLFRQFEIAFKEKREPVKAHFEFVTIKNLTGPTIKQMEAKLHIRNAISGKVLHWNGPFAFIFSIQSDHLTVHHEAMTLAQFRKHYSVIDKEHLAEEIEAQVRTTDDGKLTSRSLILHEGQPKTVGLAMSFEGSDWVFLPNYATRSRVFMPCSFDVDLNFFGDPALSPEPVRFHVEAEDWKSLRVKVVK
jgi:hypothetical protein